jgi:hypothetical protein
MKVRLLNLQVYVSSIIYVFKYVLKYVLKYVYLLVIEGLYSSVQV